MSTMVSEVEECYKVESADESRVYECSLGRQMSTVDFPYEEAVRPKSVKLTLSKKMNDELNLTQSSLPDDASPVKPQHELSCDKTNKDKKMEDTHASSPCGVDQLNSSSCEDDTKQESQRGNVVDENNRTNVSTSELNEEFKSKDNGRSSLCALKKQIGSKSLIPVPSEQVGSKDLLSFNQSDRKSNNHHSIAPPCTLHKQTGSKNLSHQNLREKVKIKTPPMIKGVSTLNVKNIDKYDTYAISDPVASPSPKIAKSKLRSVDEKGDEDIWIEMIFRHKETGKMQIMFVSKNTGRKVPDEPPSGASKVIYLKESERMMAERKEKILDELDKFATNL